MEIRSQEGEMPIPLNTSYGGVHAHHHQHHHGLIIHHDHPSDAAAATAPLIPTSAGGGGGGQPLDVAEAPVAPFKKMIKYRECLKNHAAAMGANATDGCGEFMPSGDDGTLEALTCSACGCHRNFHRKEIEGEPPSSCDNCFHPRMGGAGRKLFLGGHHKPYLTPPPPEAIGYHHHHQLIPPRAAVAPHQMIMSYNMGPGSLPSESDDQDDGGGGGPFRQPQTAKKRFRTKFTQEQKEKMLQFAEKVGWKIQKQEEGVVQQFCQEVGVKRRVLKVWMHNNKHNLGKKNNNNNTSRDLLDPSISIN